MFDWDKMKPVKTEERDLYEYKYHLKTAEDLYKEAEERRKVIIRIKKNTITKNER